MFDKHDPKSTKKSLTCTAQSGVAAGAGDNTELTSAVIDRMAAGSIGYEAGQLLVAYKTTLAAAETLKLTVKIAESDDGSTFAADETLVNASTLSTGAQTNLNGVYDLDLQLHKRKRYFKIKVTMDLSAGAADTFVYGSTVLLSAPNQMPVN